MKRKPDGGKMAPCLAGSPTIIIFGMLFCTAANNRFTLLACKVRLIFILVKSKEFRWIANKELSICISKYHHGIDDISKQCLNQYVSQFLTSIKRVAVCYICKRIKQKCLGFRKIQEGHVLVQGDDPTEVTGFIDTCIPFQFCLLFWNDINFL
jgi:hypothetical protein